MKVLYRILGTKQYLQKVGLSDRSLCLRCNNVSESILHSFCHCDQVKRFGETTEKYLVEKINFKIKFIDFIIIYGYPLHDQNNIPINTLIIVTRKHIFESSRSGSTLNISALKHNALFWNRPCNRLYDPRVGCKSRRVVRKRARKCRVSYESPTGWYTYRQDIMATPTRRRVGDVFCPASCRSTTTSPKPLTDKPNNRQAFPTGGLVSRVGIQNQDPYHTI